MSTTTKREATPRVQRAGALIEATQQAMDEAAFDLRPMLHEQLERKLTKFIGNAPWRDETVFQEDTYVRSAPVYADDANWDDDDNPPEPIDYEAVPMVVIRASCHFAAPS